MTEHLFKLPEKRETSQSLTNSLPTLRQEMDKLLAMQKAGLRPNTTGLLSTSTLREIIGAVEDQPTALFPSPEAALNLARILIASWPPRAAQPEKPYAAGLAKVFSKFPSNIAGTAIEQLSQEGVFWPAIAEVKARLERLNSEKGVLIASAKWMIKENERRAEEAADREKWKNRGTPEDLERRKAFAAKMEARFRGEHKMPYAEPERPRTGSGMSEGMKAETAAIAARNEVPMSQEEIDRIMDDKF